MDIQKIKSLVETNKRVSELNKQNYFFSSVMLVTSALESKANSALVNFYNREKNEIASFNATENGMEFSGLSPPMKETEIMPLEIDKAKMDPEEAMKKCLAKAPKESISRVVSVLRTSTNANAETGPTWQVNIFLKNFNVISTVIDAETGEEIASSKMSLSSKL
ncbi:MAG: hypothetical protein HYT71_00300 [Candidatus Aenigmarchaeota archaeon]|nr:hypothetical protein [Candidatus Aenigmarchaeota archaeon]